ncbi:uncharacterized protein SPPG_08837 [Spizellomyces punctatus DAOM BR117]|uniref:Translin-associated factor X-interacting protein 1 N-terminal domain-containing protein n=1 Tax=Spizellomyces punctatus (strain DAOM BR117) TaxID=645134 RepID=A0A0L0HUY4_SPIPD|nr:uncharacterized protein SPPG_08837 [Spizellomyces punctatus DAOM BR117]KND04674.1 hypothetical protein SPPG_08837 [Spizellomyces punctatus DAOM BR117]|eukprot:XP_016612713.1 hypothetical protein SPPG_08837 [Spizellomyces punctatus DAOM BR117]
MDSDIKRWISMSSQGHSYPGERVTLVPRAKGPVKSNFRASHVPQQRPRVMLKKMHQERAYMADLLDRLNAEQKKDVGTVWSGYLNPDVTNKKYKEVETAAKGKEKEADKAGNWISKSAVNVNTEVLDGNLASKGPTAAQSGAENTIGGVDRTLDEKTIHNVTDLHDVLEQYDAVKVRQILSPPLPETEAAPPKAAHQLPTLPAHVRARIIPSPYLNMTKHDEWKTHKEIDEILDRKDWTYKQNQFAKADQLEKLYKFVQKELEALDAPPSGPDFRRLQVYSAAFEKVIAEFKLYGPILAEIKNEYDKTIASFHNDQRELNFLRTKVQKLLSQNENRLLLKYERRKSKRLEKQLEELEAENHQLRDDLRRKLAIYAAYLPSSTLEKKKKEDTTLAEIADEIKSFKIGDDPVSVYERKIGALEVEVTERNGQIEALKKAQAEDYVPRAEKEKTDVALREAETRLEDLQRQNALLEQELHDQKAELSTVSSTLREKQEQYQFLLKEYNELSEAVAVSFDNKLLKKE